MDRFSRIIEKLSIELFRVSATLFAWGLVALGVICCLGGSVDSEPGWVVGGVIVVLCALPLLRYIRYSPSEIPHSDRFEKEKVYIDLECPGCGALVTVSKGGSARCEYCGRAVRDNA